MCDKMAKQSIRELLESHDQQLRNIVVQLGEVVKELRAIAKLIDNPQ